MVGTSSKTANTISQYTQTEVCTNMTPAVVNAEHGFEIVQELSAEKLEQAALLRNQQESRFISILKRPFHWLSSANYGAQSVENQAALDLQCSEEGLAVNYRPTSRAIDINQEETQKITQTVKSALGIIGKLFGEIPEPVQKVILALAPLLPVAYNIMTVEGSGPLWAQLFTISNLPAGLTALGFVVAALAINNNANLYRDAKRTEQNTHCPSVLSVKATNSPELLAQLSKLSSYNLMLRGVITVQEQELSQMLSFLNRAKVAKTDFGLASVQSENDTTNGSAASAAHASEEQQADTTKLSSRI